MLEKVSEYMERKSGLVSVVRDLFAFFGGAGGLIAIGLLVFKGGAAMALLNATATDVAELKRVGSVQAIAHIREDDKRDAGMDARLTVLESLYRECMKNNADIRADLARNGQKLDDMLIILQTVKKGP